MVRLKPVIDDHPISTFPFRSWAEVLDAVELKGLKIVRYRADRTPEVDRDGIVIKVHFEVVRV
jgi:hypothetical protein